MLRRLNSLILAGLEESDERNVHHFAGRLTKTFPTGKVVQGRAHGPFFLSPACWEVVQLAVHQILDLIILVRVQAPQPIF